MRCRQDEPIKSQADIKKTAEESLIEKDVKRVPLEDARVKAKLLHDVYSSTLDVMHHHYFREDRSAIPARVMEDIFTELEERENIKAGWISVNAKAMSIDHEPDTDFEKQAAKTLASGQKDYERVEKGMYQRATGISLMESRLSWLPPGIRSLRQKRSFRRTRDLYSRFRRLRRVTTARTESPIVKEPG